jgi:chaperone required for assembly of F1-ATPase
MTSETEKERFERLSRDRFGRTLSKRFYKEVSVSATHEILLDDRPVKTPLKAPLVLPNPELAEAVAQEWRAQGELINPLRMPLTKLSNTAIDRGPYERQSFVDELVAFAGSDLVCYRAAEPEALAMRQAEGWNPVLQWADRKLGAAFRTTSGVRHTEQPAEALSACRQKFETFNDFHLVALHAMIALAGSALIGLMVAEGDLEPEAAWEAANLDEHWQRELWGEDHEAKLRTESRWHDFSSAARFLNLAAMSA